MPATRLRRGRPAKFDRRAFWILSKQADSYTPRTTKALRLVLDRAVRYTAKLVADGYTPEAALAKYGQQLEAGLVEAKTQHLLPVAVRTYKTAKALVVQGKSGMHGYHAKRSVGVTFGSDELVANHLRSELGLWIASTSKIETDATAKRMADVLKRGMATGTAGVGPDGVPTGATPAEMAKALLDEGLADNANRAELMARTGTIWAGNEGASLLYRDVGYTYAEWVATNDDITCEYCGAMDGRQFELGKNIHDKGSQFTGNAGGTLSLGMAVEHPPLHPNCRCTIVPVVDDSPVEPPADTTPTPPTRPVPDLTPPPGPEALKVESFVAAVDKATTVKELEKLANKQFLGCHFGVTQKEADIGAMRMMLKTNYNLCKEYGVDPKNLFLGGHGRMRRGTYAWWSSAQRYHPGVKNAVKQYDAPPKWLLGRDGGISLNKKFLKQDVEGLRGMNAAMGRDMHSGWHPPIHQAGVEAAEPMFVHEFGHCMDALKGHSTSRPYKGWTSQGAANRALSVDGYSLNKNKLEESIAQSFVQAHYLTATKAQVEELLKYIPLSKRVLKHYGLKNL